MADNKPSKRPASGATAKSSSDTEKSSSSSESTSPTLNKAQAEFQRYMKRMETQRLGSGGGFMMPLAISTGNEGAPVWAVPPSVAMLPHGSGGGPGFFAAIPSGDATGASLLTNSLGSTIRLGFDVINAALASSVRLLNGISGAAYGGYGEQGHMHSGCGCHSGCDCGGHDCCSHDCCGYDCCGCECCNPGVGTCC